VGSPLLYCCCDLSQVLHVLQQQEAEAAVKSAELAASSFSAEKRLAHAVRAEAQAAGNTRMGWKSLARPHWVVVTMSLWDSFNTAWLCSATLLCCTCNRLVEDR
jgi:hypothetical protein